MHRDLLRQVEPEPVEFVQRGAQQRGVVAVGSRDHAPDRDAVPIDHQGAFGALFSPVNRGTSRDFPAAGGFDDTAVDAEVVQLEPDDAVVRFQADLFQRVEDTGGDPFIPAGAQGGRRAGGIGDLGVGGAEDEDLDECVEG